MQRLVLAFLLLGITPAAAADLALKRVMLSSAGVGYFEYETEVDGPATLGLDVPLDQVDDVLTSLVVFDSTGAVGTVELPGRDNTRANFGNVPFGPEALRSTVDYLNSLQGVEIGVQGPRPMTGRIVHAERVAETLPAPAGQPQPTVQRTRVTILGADGLRQFVLEEADSIQVTDPDLRARIGQALEFAAPRGEPEPAPRHAAQHRRRPSHGARRLCRRGAAVEGVVPAGAACEGRRSRAPAGLGGAGEPVGRQLGRHRADLQYGNPVTFRQAIYQSYYVQRPEVPVEILGRILPSVDTRARPAELAMQKAASPPRAPPGCWPRRPLPRRRRCRSRRSWPRPRTRCRPPKAWRRRSSSLPRRWCSPPATPPACRSSIAASRPSAWTLPPATTRIRCRRSASPMIPDRRSPPAC